MTIDSKLKAVIDRFVFPGELTECQEIKTGHINVTYRLRFEEPGGQPRDYVLQRINSFVFKKPDEVMENVRLVTEHLSRAMIARGDDPENRVLRLVPTLDGGKNSAKNKVPVPAGAVSAEFRIDCRSAGTNDVAVPYFSPDPQKAPATKARTSRKAKKEK